MSFYDDASLIVYPSGYKEDKIYSLKPTNGTGDLNFSRASSATRVNAEGLIEGVRTNLYPRGSALLSTGWNSAGDILTAGQTDPNGGTGALRVQLSVGTSYIFQAFSGSSTYNRSAYIKAATAQTIRLAEPFTGATVACNLTTSYQRFDLSAIGGAGNFGIQFDNTNDNLSKDFTIAFIQIETGEIATEYIPTTTAAVSVGMFANVPRIDYSNGCGSLLLEPQSTNLVTYSEDFSNADWSKGGSSVTSGFTSPDGTANAYKLVEDTSTGVHSLSAIYASSQTGYKTWSICAKAGERNWFVINAYYGGDYKTYFDLTNGVVGTSASGNTSTITKLANGWYRCTVTRTSVTPHTIYNGYGVAEADNDDSFSGDGTNGLYIFGAQLEASSYSTSYIPSNSGTTTTRIADAASKTGLSSVINDSEGVLYAEVSAFVGANTDRQITINDGTTSDRLSIALLSNGTQINFVIVAGGSVSVNKSVTIPTITSGTKIAFAYKANDFKIYANGLLIASQTSGAVPTGMDTLGFDRGDGNDKFYGNCQNVMVFPSALTDDELADLTGAVHQTFNSLATFYGYTIL